MNTILVISIFLVWILVFNTKEEKFYRGTNGWQYALNMLNDGNIIVGFDLANISSEQLSIEQNFVTDTRQGTSAVSSKYDTNRNNDILNHYTTGHTKLWNKFPPPSLDFKSHLNYDAIVNSPSTILTPLMQTKESMDMKQCLEKEREFSEQLKNTIKHTDKKKYNNLLEVISVPVIMQIDGPIKVKNYFPSERVIGNAKIIKAYTTKPLSPSQKEAFRDLGVPIPKFTNYFKQKDPDSDLTPP